MTDTGTLVVDGMFASCYTFTQYDLAHLTTWLYRSFPWQQNGYSPILSNLVDLAELILPENLHVIHDVYLYLNVLSIIYSLKCYYGLLWDFIWW